MAAALTSSPLRFASAGIELAGERWNPSGESRGDVVLLAGGGQTRHSFGRTAARLAEHGWSTITYDARGHGDSDWDPQRDYSIDAFAGDLLALIEVLGRPPVVVGASLGGMTALIATGEHPGSTRALVLVDVVVRLEQKGVGRIIDFMTANPDGFATLDEVADAIAAYNPNRSRPRNLDGLRKNVRQGPDGRWRWHWDPAFIQIRDEPQRRTSAERLRAAAENVRVPTLLVRGVQSDVVSAEGMQDMLRLIPGSRAIDVEAAGHMVAGDDNDVFTASLESFLDDLS